jgi:hypothetical protein
MTHPEAERIEDLREEARYRRERLELCGARLYAGPAHRLEKLSELQRSYDGAAARHRRAEASGRLLLSGPDRHHPRCVDAQRLPVRRLRQPRERSRMLRAAFSSSLATSSIEPSTSSCAPVTRSSLVVGIRRRHPRRARG